MAPKERVIEVSPMNPEEFASGRPDDLTATIKRVRYQPFKFAGSKTGKYMLFAMVDFEPDEDSGFANFTEPYQAGFLDQSVPSKDGKTPAGLDWDTYGELAAGTSAIEAEDMEPYEGTYTIGRRIGKGLDWHQFLDALREVGFADWGPDSTCIEGARVHLNRMRSDRQPKQPVAGQPVREWQVLKPTQLIEVVKQKKASVAAVKSSGGKTVEAAGSNGNSDLSDRLVGVIVEIIAENDNSISKTKLVPKFTKHFKGKELTEAMALAKDLKFIGSAERPWNFDAESGTLTIGE